MDSEIAQLRACPHCDNTQPIDPFDTALAASMNDVPLPAGLHERLLKSASVRRNADFRRAVGRYLALAATVLVALGVGAGTYWRTRPEIDTNDLAIRTDLERETPQETVQNWLVLKHLPATLPLDFDYRRHSIKGIAELGDIEVPFVEFRRGNDFARVYIVKDSDAKLGTLKDAQSSLCKVTILRIPGRPDIAYVILHSTDTLDPFLRQQMMPVLG